MPKNLFLNQDLHHYIFDQTYRGHPVLEAIHASNGDRPGGRMQTDVLQAQFMQLLLKLLGAKRVLELGTFTGYSALAMALALPDGGQVVTCDVDAAIVEVAKSFWAQTPEGSKIKSVLQDGLSFMKSEPDASYDVVFIDAVKNQYEAYFEEALRLVPQGGLIMIDNVLWSGKVLESDPADPRTKAIQTFNESRHNDQRIDLCLIPVGDGLTLARKR